MMLMLLLMMATTTQETHKAHPEGDTLEFSIRLINIHFGHFRAKANTASCQH